MKEFFFIRHAKSSWDDLTLPDIDRPLNQRGYRDAERMSEFLFTKYNSVDYMLISPALRTRQTADFFLKKYGEVKYSFEQRIYHCMISDIHFLLRRINDNVDRVFLFGHNPCATQMANTYGPFKFDNVPTCGIVVYKSNIDKWSELEKENTQVDQYYFPKLI